jgi:hypothetical protein
VKDHQLLLSHREADHVVAPFDSAQSTQPLPDLGQRHARSRVPDLDRVLPAKAGDPGAPLALEELVVPLAGGAIGP